MRICVPIELPDICVSGFKRAVTIPTSLRYFICPQKFNAIDTVQANTFMKTEACLFIVDLLACLPLHYVVHLVGHNTVDSSIGGLEFLYMVQLLKLFRLVHVNRSIRKLEEKLLASKYVVATKMTFYVIAVLLVTHSHACVWFLIGSFESDIGGVMVSGWTAKLPHNASQTHIYLISLHGVFNAQLYAGTDAETAFSVASEVAVGLLFGLIAGTMSSIVMTATMAEQLYKENMWKIKEFLNAKEVPQALRARIVASYETIYQRKTVFDDKEILEQLPPIISTDLVNFMYADIIREVVIFQPLPMHITSQICSKLHPASFSSGQKITREGDFGGDLFIIIRGWVQFSKADGTRCNPRFYGKGGCFGELPIVFEALRELGKCLPGHSVSEADKSKFEINDSTVKACEQSNLCFLRRTDALELMRQQYKLRLQMVKVYVQKQRRQEKPAAATGLETTTFAAMVANSSRRSDGTFSPSNLQEQFVCGGEV